MVLQFKSFALWWLLASALRGATVGATDRIVPLVHDGGGWSTRITITNLSTKPATVIATFLTPQSFNETWRPDLKSTAGKAKDNAVEIPLAPGATAIVETGGTAATLTRGFAEVAELADEPIGVLATLTQRDGARLVQSLQISLAPAHERRSVLPVDLADPLNEPRLVWVSMTSSTALDIVFRNLNGETVLSDQLNFDGRAQLFVNVREHWPQLKEFRGTIQWCCRE